MAILFVDTEHDLVHDDAERGPLHRAKRAVVERRLATAAGAPCLTRRFAAVTPAEVARLAPAAIVIGGNTTEWDRFEPATLAGLLTVIRAAPAPILGICAGHQLIGLVHGASWGALGPLRPGEVDPDPRFATGQRKERGFLPVELDRACPLFRGLPPTATFFQSHSWHLEAAPAGFAVRAQSAWSPIQAIEGVDQRVFGVQFHPERGDQDHPAGDIVLANFLALAEG